MKTTLFSIWLGLLGAAMWPIFAQTQLDLRTQAKQVDFSAASRTKPFKTGITLPVTCSTGEAFFKTDAPAGQNLYGCTATNTWTLQSGAILSGGGAGSPNYGATFGGLTSVSIPGANHRMATMNLLVSCYDTSTPSRAVEPDSVLIDTNSYDVTINFAVPQSGSCVVNGSGGSSSSPSDSAASAGSLRTLDVMRVSNLALTIGATCSMAAPCNVRFGSTVYGITSSATVTLTSAATGTALIYMLRDGALAVGSNLGVTCTGCRAQANTTTFPVDALPLYTWTATNGIWDPAGGVDRRAFLSAKVLAAGPGVVLSDNGLVTTASVDTAIVPAYLTGAASLDFPSVAAGACSNDVTLTVPGAAVGDAVAAGWPSVLAAGLVGTMRVSAADVVSVRLCNLSAAAIDPAPATYRATIVRSF